MIQFGEIRVTFGVTPELERILTAFVDRLPNNPVSEEIQTEEAPIIKEQKAPTKQPKKSKADKSPVVEEVVSSEVRSEAAVEDKPTATPKNKENVEVNTEEAITVEAIRAKVKSIITSNRDDRPKVEAKFAELGATNPTNLDVEHYKTFWDFLNTLG